MTKNQPNLTQKQLKKPDLERKSKGKRENWRWRTHGGWVLARDGECTVEWRAREWSTVEGSQWG
jgi:hypothetical protein